MVDGVAPLRSDIRVLPKEVVLLNGVNQRTVLGIVRSNKCVLSRTAQNHEGWTRSSIKSPGVLFGLLDLVKISSNSEMTSGNCSVLNDVGVNAIARCKSEWLSTVATASSTISKAPSCPLSLS